MEIELARRATEIDPEYSEALAWLGYLLFSQGNVLGNKSMQTVVWDAHSYFEKALNIDPNNATAHNGLGWINEFQTYDYVMAEKEILKAIELEPNNILHIPYYIEFLVRRHRMDDAFVQSKRIGESGNNLAGGNPWVTKFWIYSLTGQQEEFLQMCGEFLNGDNYQAQEFIGQCLIHMKKYDSAVFH